MITQLRHLAKYCELGTLLSGALPDTVAAGLGKQSTLRSFFVIEDLTFDDACKVAVYREPVAKQTAMLHHAVVLLS